MSSDQSTDCHVGLGSSPGSVAHLLVTGLGLLWMSVSLSVKGDWTRWCRRPLPLNVAPFLGSESSLMGQTGQCHLRLLAAAEPGPGRGWLPGTAAPRQSPGSPKSGMSPQAAVTMTHARVLPGWGPGLL